jgi:hypothetical protein
MGLRMRLSPAKQTQGTKQTATSGTFGARLSISCAPDNHHSEYGELSEAATLTTHMPNLFLK